MSWYTESWDFKILIREGATVQLSWQWGAEFNRWFPVSALIMTHVWLLMFMSLEGSRSWWGKALALRYFPNYRTSGNKTEAVPATQGSWSPCRLPERIQQALGSLPSSAWPSSTSASPRSDSLCSPLLFWVKPTREHHVKAKKKVFIAA